MKLRKPEHPGDLLERMRSGKSVYESKKAPVKSSKKPSKDKRLGMKGLV